MLDVQEKHVKDCARLARQRGALAYAFGANDIDWKRKCIAGWTFELPRLEKVEYPLPDVVYDRVSSRRVERMKAVT